MKIEQKTLTIDIVANRTKNALDTNCTDCAIEYHRLTGEYIDWHEFSDYLDELYRKGFLKITSPGGRTGYRVDFP